MYPSYPIRSDKVTTKVRIVMDASARPKGQPTAPSLNDCLHTGPNLLKDLTGILLRWRQMEHMVIGDLEKAFLMLGVREQDRDATRFLWVSNPHNANLDNFHFEKCRIYRFKRLSFGLSFSPFGLNCTLREHLSIYNSDLATRILTNIYVDNILISLKAEENPVEVCREAIQIFA